MKENYILNPKTGTIHIVGYCHLSNPPSPDWKTFSTEEDARASYGSQSAGLCKLCLRKREEKIGKETMTK